jgi:hypothetical protein
VDGGCDDGDDDDDGSYNDGYGDDGDGDDDGSYSDGYGDDGDDDCMLLYHLYRNIANSEASLLQSIAGTSP